jgi:hypothetical protein
MTLIPDRDERAAQYTPAGIKHVNVKKGQGRASFGVFRVGYSSFSFREMVKRHHGGLNNYISESHPYAQISMESLH